ncbi:efflux RND transporter periplasmic adaptor subunit [Candidatus Chloroploca sp. Khr17]|uniref:efflux RND transporter periplasmic adaptor subunit n=1 Tax=Candidatus Chloroploca sp. Khr17 TaxID=2496869 RepID=UPI00101C6FD2|nr:efflux RND transporter periplasmic adaptor subunit [Candidatus Chloroploca sp. Khr17]
MTTLPQSRSSNRRRLSIAAIIAGILVVALLATLGFRTFAGGQADPLASTTLAPVTRSDLRLGVSATGSVEPRVQANLAFGLASGRVVEVLVSTGDRVAAGDMLVRLDDRQLTAARDASAAALARAEADLIAVKEGATEAQIAEASAQIQAAQGSLVQTQGTVTAADVSAARAAVEEARARLAVIEAGPRDDARTRAASTLAEAQADLERQRSALSAAKEQAGKNVETRANAVRNAQSAYSTAYWDLEHVKTYETDPRTLRSLTDAQTQDYVVALERATLALADAEAALRQADVEYQNAIQNEISGLASAEARVQAAQTDLDTLLTGAEADVRASARAQLARAEAELARLTGAQRSGAIAAQAGNVEAARARLEQLTADPQVSDLARAEAGVAQARAQLDQAQIQLDDTILRAPFDGVVASLNVAPGETVGNTVPLVLIDVSRFLVKVTVDEVDIARVQLGQSVQVLLDALGETLPGTVVSLESLPQTGSSVTAYQVTVEIDPDDSALKPGMTASATIVAAERSDVLTIPTSAVRSEGGQQVVRVVVTDANGERTIEERTVEVGLRTSDRVEIVGGLVEGDEVALP